VARYAVVLTSAARRALKKITDRATLRRLAAAIEALAETPRPPGATALQGAAAGTLRVRVGDYRVIYQVHDAELTVLVVALGHRGDIYR
jgi:mRNA interferase RelE/StbE